MIFKEKDRVRFDVNTIYQGHHKITYRGIKAIKCPFDYVIYQMLVFELRPDLIIEIGTNKGGAALYLADLLNIVGKGEVHTIDILKNYSDESLKSHSRVKTFEDGYQNYDLRLTEGYQTIMVIEDGSHTYEDTLGAMQKFSPIVTLGSYLIVEDGIISKLKKNKEFNGGPLRAIDEFLQDRDDFIIDRNWTDLFGENATFNVNGYLKRIK
ncbi:MAG TPA: CmcI family methyltransferase [Puia sp.]|nr:CmcI family methyltransferase [Puia sp.]